MPADSIAQSALKAVITTRDRTDLLKEITEVKVQLSKISSITQEDIQKHYPIICKILQNVDQELDKNINQNFQELLEILEKQVTEFKLVVIQVPESVLQSISQLEKILSTWARENLNSDALIDIQSNPSLVAGITCSFNGMYRDITLDKVLTKTVYA